MAQAMGLPVTGMSDAQAARAFVLALAQLNADLGITTRLRDVGVTDADLDALVDGASKVTRLLNNNPRPMGRDDMRAIYASVL
jgi:alcohol dehydrogenase class IV